MRIVLILFIGLPWLNPVTYGPTVSAMQLITAWVCAISSWIALLKIRWQPDTQVPAIATAWLLAATISALIGLLQYLGLSAAFGPLINYVEAGQAYANLRQRNQLATLLAIGVCALLWWQAQPSWKVGPKARSFAVRWVLGWAAVVLATADAATGSRIGMLQLVLLLGLSQLWMRGRGTLAWMVAVYAVAAVVLPRLAGLDPLHSGILGRVGEASAPCSSRLTLWSNAIELIAQKPWTGWGWGELGYAHFMHLYAGERFCEIMGNAHNLPLHLAAELGIPAAVLMCGTLVWLVWRAKPWQEHDATRQMAWGVLAAIAAHSMVEYPLWYGPFQLAALLAVWMLWQTAPLGPIRQGVLKLPAILRSYGPGALACVVLLACSYAAWDYWRISQIYVGESARAPYYREDTLDKIRPSWLFSNQVKFAELGITPLDADNAAYIHALALDMLHFSPEASVAKKIIDSDLLLGQPDEAQYYRQRLQAAYPQDYAAWLRGQTSDTDDEAP